ncbi:MAG: DUF2523 domain-containing protein [Kangiellaceae bacterium]|nr:DUF2523 domain-containing protein [Kangiellaceae bacterium]
MDAIFSFFDFIVEFFTVDVYDFVMSAWHWIVTNSILLYLKMKYWSLEFAWSVASAILVEINIGQQISQAFGLLSPETTNAINLLRIPEGIGYILQAIATKFVLRFI